MDKIHSIDRIDLPANLCIFCLILKVIKKKIFEIFLTFEKHKHCISKFFYNSFNIVNVLNKVKLVLIDEIVIEKPL